MKLQGQNDPLNILLADDDPDDRFFFEEALKAIPISNSVITVSNGEELMDYLRQSSTLLPDVLFLDISMPRKTGIECLIEIKNDKRLEAIPVIMFTTSYTRGVELDLKLSDTLANMGALDFIRKPAGFDQVKEVLHEALIKISEKSHMAAEPDNINEVNVTADVRQMNILLADDDIDDCNFFRKALKAVPLFTHLTTVPGGRELMKYLNENIERLPNVLFLDINMPGKNGFECLAEIKQNEKLKDLPVVMFSTSNEQDKISILFKGGADIYVRKPAKFADLVQVIHHALPLATDNIFSNGKLKYVLNS